MSDGNSSANTVLLWAILLVLLFGASAFLTGLAWAAGIGAVLAVMVIVGTIVGSTIRGIILGIESLPNWLPKVPKALGVFFWGWLYWIGSPVLAPIGHWQKMNERGQRVGVIAAGFSLVWVFVVSLFFSLFAVVVPLLIIATVVGFLVG